MGGHEQFDTAFTNVMRMWILKMARGHLGRWRASEAEPERGLCGYINNYGMPLTSRSSPDASPAAPPACIRGT